MTSLQWRRKAHDDGVPQDCSKLQRVEETTLLHLLDDSWRLEESEQRLQRHLDSAESAAPGAMILVDLDRSIEVRILGREAKLSLLAQVRGALRDVIPEASHWLDAGQRDKTFAFIGPEALGSLSAFVDEARSAVSERCWRIDSTTSVRTTATVGAAVCRSSDALELTTSARDAVVRGKRAGGDCWFIDRLDWDAVGGNPDPAGVARLWRGLLLLAEKHGPVSYWVLSRGLALPSIRAGAARWPRPAAAMFEELISQVRRESAGADPPYAEPMTPELRGLLGRPWANRVLSDVAARTGRNSHQLTAEAISLAERHAALWTTTPSAPARSGICQVK